MAIHDCTNILVGVPKVESLGQCYRLCPAWGDYGQATCNVLFLITGCAIADCPHACMHDHIRGNPIFHGHEHGQSDSYCLRAKELGEGGSASLYLLVCFVGQHTNLPFPSSGLTYYDLGRSHRCKVSALNGIKATFASGRRNGI